MCALVDPLLKERDLRIAQSPLVGETMRSSLRKPGWHPASRRRLGDLSRVRLDRRVFEQAEGRAGDEQGGDLRMTLCVSTTGLSPVTVTVSCSEPTRRSALIVAVNAVVSESATAQFLNSA
jgi:hypothetical protein